MALEEIKEILGQYYYFNIGQYNQGTNWFNAQDTLIRDKILLTIFTDALANKKHVVMWNIIQIYSMAEYNSISNIGEQIIKLALENNDYDDVKELALFAIETWGHFSDREYLEGLVFTNNYLNQLKAEVLEEIYNEKV